MFALHFGVAETNSLGFLVCVCIALWCCRDKLSRGTDISEKSFVCVSNRPLKCMKTNSPSVSNIPMNCVSV